MKTYESTSRPAVGGVMDSRSTRAPAAQAPRPRLNDKRSTR